MNIFFGGDVSKVALEIAGNTYTFFDIKSKAEELREIFHEEFKPGQRVLVSSENIFIFVSSLLALNKIGLVFCCWNGRSNIADLQRLIKASGCVKTSGNSGKVICEQFNTCADKSNYSGDFIITTSGSSGAPKGVLLTLDNIISNAKEAGKCIDFNNYKLEKWCIDIDFSLMSAISHLFMAWHAGIPLRSLKNDSHIQILESFQSHKIGLGGAPLQISRLSKDVAHFYDGCLLVSSGDFLSEKAIEKILSKHKTLSICTFYGLTELSGRYCYMDANDVRSKPGAAGRPIVKGSLRIDQTREGEIIASSPYLFSGYLNKKGCFEKAKKDFLTGDIACIDEDNYVWLKGRISDTFKVSGEKVNRKIIEETLSHILKKYEFCILPVKHEMMGSCCALFVATADRKSIIPLKNIVLAIREKLPSNCIPVYSYLLDFLPRLENGKLDKQYLINNHKIFDRYK